MATINVGIIGLGKFGRNYLRTFAGIKNANIGWICASSQKSLNEAGLLLKQHPFKSTSDYMDVLKDKNVDSVAIITPGSTHYALVKKALNAGKNVIAEKPLAFSSAQAEELYNIAHQKKKTLMVSNIHRFNPGIKRIKNDAEKGKFGKVNYVKYDHFGNGPIRKDMGALWDFFPHAASIFLYLFEAMPSTISASGISFT